MRCNAEVHSLPREHTSSAPGNALQYARECQCMRVPVQVLHQCTLVRSKRAAWSGQVSATGQGKVSARELGEVSTRRMGDRDLIIMRQVDDSKADSEVRTVKLDSRVVTNQQ
eukprot:scaffold272343_cov21-Tisochrysis_lutea.AAC.1